MRALAVGLLLWVAGCTSTQVADTLPNTEQIKPTLKLSAPDFVPCLLPPSLEDGTEKTIVSSYLNLVHELRTCEEKRKSLHKSLCLIANCQ